MMTLASRTPRQTFVLVHGSWHGGWCWRDVAAILEASGHRVFTPTLTGLGERSHLMSAAINLDTHIADVVDVFRQEQIEEAVLVGHSYGGWVISGALEEIGSQVSAAVFLDAHVPKDGERGLERAHFRALIEAVLESGGMAIDPPSAEFFHVKPERRDWVNALLTPQPIGVSLQPIRLTGARERVPRKVYIRGTGLPSHTFDAYRNEAEANGWRIYDVDCGHDVMVDEPEKLAEILVDS
ncbi:MAG TPA: alpha/beta fold hydrolase [Thermoanaerobaculia bacterium]|nr:alpha/beta fold hydrolase [Thermoanaerobaculia bacterium]